MTDPIARLTALLGRLPGIGEKSALRLALAIVKAKDSYPQELSKAILDASTRLRLCSICADLTVESTCSICSDARRNGALICVVSRPQDRIAMERAAVYRGRYHVLHGVLDPLNGIGPNELRIRELLERLRGSEAREVILATSTTVEGDATALYLARLLGPIGVKVTRIASGLAVGGDLEYADMATLDRALAERRAMAEAEQPEAEQPEAEQPEPPTR